MEIFNSYGINFKFNPSHNKDIAPFNWYINSLKNQKWEPETFEVFKKCSNKEKIALDIGSWIGATSIVLSQLFHHVYCFEPDPVALEALKLNLKDNNCSNVDVIPKALFSKETTLDFGLNPAFAHEGMGASTSQLNSSLSTISVLTTTLDQLSSIIPFDKVGFVKVDIEGAEEHIMQDLFHYALKYKWDILLELHPQFMSNPNLDRFNPLFNLYPNVENVSHDQKFFSF